MAADEQACPHASVDAGAAPEPHVPPHSRIHRPVLLDRCLELLAPAISGPGAVVVDGTLGLGGHTAAMLAAHPSLTVVGIDRDPDALRRAAERLGADAGRVRFVHAIYDAIPDALVQADVDSVDGFLFDLGVSSLQLDEDDRGFSYARDAPLDMRMDTSRGITAADVLNTYSHGDLTRVLRTYGEEKFAPRIASAILREREKAPLTSSARLVELVRDSIPAPARRTGGNPAKRTFQALRIEVNGELDALRDALPAALDAVRPGGRIVVMSYQSLEDRLVKQAFAAVTQDRTPPELPVVLPEYGPRFRLLTRGAEVAGPEEIEANPRAASVRLRAVERLGTSESGVT
ncbi:16S rRNA (cytosine(1402)-N(4))-methyltransferase RsmH [Cryptosporangium sp. NPDC051539]|uniref:16S rRNA (cytosine(1402)-N(4))-methyltransferase RsmH n=1 Tax=Cryptosporangium sp. NPDC051539 TaxID=3363962 RepID=UPI0037A14F0D